MQDTPASGRATLIRYRDPKGAIDWLGTAFRFETRFVSTRTDGSFGYAHLALGDQQVTVTARDERSLGPVDGPDEAQVEGAVEPAALSSGERRLVVTDIAAHIECAKAAGAEIVRGLEAGAYACRDVEGNIWTFRAAKVQRSAPLLAWTRAYVPRIEKRAGLTVAAALTLAALAVPLWQLASKTPSEAPLKIAEGQALEHARFALAEEQAARLAAEASRQATLAELANERSARLAAQDDAQQFEAELAAARTAAEQPTQELDNQLTWETQVARAAVSTSAPAPAEVVPVSAAHRSEPASAVAPPPAAMSTNPLLAAGQAALAKGDVAEARRKFRRLADEGMAEAALALGSTYDPINADHAGLASAEADPEQAKRWYRRAIELTREASKRRGAP